MFNIESPAGVRAWLQQYGLYPRKRWGQNFLFDHNILHNIVQAGQISGEDLVLEIGPGLGGLTRALAAESRGVLAVEIDRDFAPVLAQTLQPYDNVRLLFQDILETDIEQELQKAFSLEEMIPYKICGNIPYNITSPIIFQILEHCPHMQMALLMMQKEVAQRILADPGSKTYGLLTLMVNYYAQVEWVMNVSPHCFYPRPDVDSTVIKIIPRSHKIWVRDEALFKNIMRAAFQQRRKTILNACARVFKDKIKAAAILEAAAIGLNHRPENLTVEDFARIANEVSS